MLIRYSWVVLVSLLTLSAFSLNEEGDACATMEGSIQISNEYTPESLVRDVLTKGVCNNVSNVQSIGNLGGIGYFSNGEDIFGFEEGIILSTGLTTNAFGPNEYIDRSSNFNDNGGDADLAQLATGAVKDVVGLEFDFVPLDSFIEFTYVFASEEYCEFVGSDFNDVFGFFISGPGINGSFSNAGENVAFVPGSGQYVSVNTINHNSNADYYIGNLNEAGADRCNTPFVNQPNINRIEYDGFTTPLSAVLKLTPCETYHIKMVIGDVKDHFYDSAVFLKAGSFNLGGAVRVSTEAVVEGEILQEGCDNAYFVFEREDDSSTNFPLQVNFVINEESTAEEGVDFNNLPTSITIPAGAMSAILPIHALNDNEEEGDELIILELNIPCACYSDTAYLHIIDAPPFHVNLEDVVVCEIGTTTIIPELTGGSPPYTYQWNTGAITPQIDISADQGLYFSLTVTDDCGQVGMDDFNITVEPAPFATLSGNVQICEGEVGYLTAEFTGTPPWELHYTVNGVLQPPITDLGDSPFLLPVTAEGTYEITNFYDNDCAGYISGIGTVDVWKIEVETNIVPPTCFGSDDGSITLDISGDNPPFQVVWGHTGDDNPTLSNLEAGQFAVTITDREGCTKVIDITLPTPGPLAPVQPDCESIHEGVNLQAAGGTPPYLYSIDGAPFGDESIFQQLTPGEEYQLLVEDANGCQVVQNFQMPYFGTSFFTLSGNEEVKDGEPYTLSPEIFLPEALIDSIIWQPATNLDCTDCPTPTLTIHQPVTYTLTIIDRFGCRQTASIRLSIDPTVDIFIPTAFSPNGDQVNDLLTVNANDYQVVEVEVFQVFDRWGGQLYEATNFLPNNPRIGWDGTARGQALPKGVYVYYLRVRLNDGRVYELGGDVLLMR